jgi:ABC-type multidrug transport system permease subunit
MRELKDMGTLLMGFLPWLLFLFFSGHSLQSLERISWVCLVASLTFGFFELRSGFMLQWGTLLFFAACILLVNFLQVSWVATQMDLLANLSLASLVWITLLCGEPFALQYARKGLPKERWNDPSLLKGCRFITLVWAVLISLSVGVSVYRRSPAPQATEQAYFGISLTIIAVGVIFTTLYKRQKRLQRENHP